MNLFDAITYAASQDIYVAYLFTKDKNKEMFDIYYVDRKKNKQGSFASSSAVLYLQLEKAILNFFPNLEINLDKEVVEILDKIEKLAEKGLRVDYEIKNKKEIDSNKEYEQPFSFTVNLEDETGNFIDAEAQDSLIDCVNSVISRNTK